MPRPILITAALVACLLTGVSHADAVVRLTTSKGDIDIELYPDRAPDTVANFLQLVDDGFYEGLIFHRVLANFVIQAGGYEPNLTYREPPRTVKNESTIRLGNKKGTVAMARMTDPDSADAQFFINVRNNDYLNAAPGKPGYTVFGKVIEGWDTVVEIELTDVGMRQGMQGVPTEPVVIHRAVRLEPPAAAGKSAP